MGKVIPVVSRPMPGGQVGHGDSFASAWHVQAGVAGSREGDAPGGTEKTAAGIKRGQVEAGWASGGTACFGAGSGLGSGGILSR